MILASNNDNTATKTCGPSMKDADAHQVLTLFYLELYRRQEDPYKDPIQQSDLRCFETIRKATCEADPPDASSSRINDASVQTSALASR